MRMGNKALYWVLGVALLGLQFGIMSSAHAWERVIGLEAFAECDQDTFELFITYTASEQSGDQPSQNNQIDILFNGVKVAEGAFNADNGYSFTGRLPYPGAGDVAVTAVAVGHWWSGHPTGQSTSVTVAYPTEPCEPEALGRFTGGGHLWATDIDENRVKVTRGLTIHCDLLLSNNLEVNWGGGNKFHMTEHLTTVACTDSPDIIQFPPEAPLDTLIGVGTGRFNGEDGYTIEFILQDYGEPGSSDKMGILIYNTATSEVVLNVPNDILIGGNLQAHYDQPHK